MFILIELACITWIAICNPALWVRPRTDAKRGSLLSKWLQWPCFDRCINLPDRPVERSDRPTLAKPDNLSGFPPASDDSLPDRQRIWSLCVAMLHGRLESGRWIKTKSPVAHLLQKHSSRFLANQCRPWKYAWRDRFSLRVAWLIGFRKQLASFCQFASASLQFAYIA